MSRSTRKITLLPAALSAAFTGTVIAFAAYWVLIRVIHTSSVPAAPIDVTKLAFTVVGGIGGVVALVIAYRRQSNLEQGKFVERFGAAAAQLGHSDVAVRIAGVYAMAVTADESTGLLRQQCIDVLCGYLRLPYDADRGNNHQTKDIHKYPALDSSSPENERHFEYRQNDSEVRKTIAHVIAMHLRKDVEHSWSAHNFDFRGAYFEKANFSKLTFAGDTLFIGATFYGTAEFHNTTFEARAEFSQATFIKGRAMFDGVKFESALFDHVTFTDGADFTRAFFAGHAGFHRVKFIDGTTSFKGAQFLKTADFNRATLKSIAFGRACFFGVANFRRTIFNRDVDFSNASFRNRARFGHAIFTQKAMFKSAKFHDRAVFEAAEFSNAIFDDVIFLASSVFRDAVFHSALFQRVSHFGPAEFVRTSFSGTTNFVSARFAGQTDFTNASFSGPVDFSNSSFGAASVSFLSPRQWGPPAPIFDWNNDIPSKPANVIPQTWPPTVAR